MVSALRVTGCVVEDETAPRDGIGTLAVCSQKIDLEMVFVDRKVEE